jgi:hypothetical protein
MCLHSSWTPAPAYDLSALAPHVHYHLVRTVTVTYTFTEEIDVWT